jgi:hypothetical protein
MPVPSNQPQNSQTIWVIVIFIACLCVVYWRTPGGAAWQRHGLNVSGCRLFRPPASRIVR